MSVLTVLLADKDAEIARLKSLIERIEDEGREASQRIRAQAAEIAQLKEDNELLRINLAALNQRHAPKRK